jgi:RNA polymerase sigma factor (sigma-70 family)
MEDSSPEALFASHGEIALRISINFRVPRMSIAERLHEAQIALWDAAVNFDSKKGAFEPFAATVIRNHLRDLYNKAKREQEVIADLPEDMLDRGDDEAGGNAPVDPLASPLSEAERADIRAAIADELNGLTKEQREVLLRYAEGTTYSAIARERRVSKAAVRQMAQRAIDQVRPNLQKKGINVHFSFGGSQEHNSTSDLAEFIYAREILKQKSRRWLQVLVFVIAILGCIFKVLLCDKK